MSAEKHTQFFWRCKTTTNPKLVLLSSGPMFHIPPPVQTVFPYQLLPCWRRTYQGSMYTGIWRNLFGCIKLSRIMIGGNIEEDRKSSSFGNINKQVDRIDDVIWPVFTRSARCARWWLQTLCCRSLLFAPLQRVPKKVFPLWRAPCTRCMRTVMQPVRGDSHAPGAWGISCTQKI